MVTSLSRLPDELRYAVGSLRRTPVAAAAACLTLASAITAALAVEPALRAVISNPLGVYQPDRLVVVTEGNTAIAGLASLATFAETRRLATIFEEVALIEASRQGRYMVLTGDGDTMPVILARVNSSYFTVLQHRMVSGRAFSASEQRQGAQPVVIISEELWARRFHRRADVVGRSIVLNQRPHLVIGVTARLRGLSLLNPDLWAPIPIPSSPEEEYLSFRYQIIARLRPGVPLERVQKEVSSRYAALIRTKRRLAGYRTSVELLERLWLGRTRVYMLAVSMAVVLALVVASGNVAAVLLARASSRHAAVTLRACLGAARSDIVRLFLAESLVLAFTAGLLGLLLSNATWGIVRSLAPLRLVPLPENIATWHGLLTVAALVVVIGFACAAAPWWLYLRRDLFGSPVRTGGIVTRRAWRIRTVLVVAQVSLGVALALATLTTYRSFAAVVATSHGISAPEQVVTFRTSVLGTPDCQCQLLSKQSDFYGRLVDSLSSVPGVQAAAVTSGLPFVDQSPRSEFWVENTDEPEVLPFASIKTVTGSYFRVMGVQVIAGRTFGREDTSTSEPVGVVNERLAAYVGGVRGAVGKRLRLNPRSNQTDWIRVVAVVRDVKNNGLESPAEPEVFLPHTQMPSPIVRVVLRTATSAEVLIPAVRAALARFDTFLPMAEVQTMESVLRDSLASRRFATVLMGAFAALTILLVGLAVYGLQSLSVSNRQRDIAVARALGATPRDVLRPLAVSSLKVLGAGLVFGTGGYVMGVAPQLGSLVFEVSALDASAVIIALATAGLAVGIGTALPARRAVAIEPASLLRVE